MEVSGERYSPQINNAVLGPFEPYISYEHWHRYCYAAPFVRDKIVLDIACGEGYGSAFLARKAAKVYGVDVCPEAVQHARQHYIRDNLCFLQGSAGDIPISDPHCLDTIISFETIEHLDAATQHNFAREAKRLLKPDGVLLISTPNRLVYTEAINHHNPYHLREFTNNEFHQFLGEYFEHIHMLSQRVYPSSYIWNVAAPTRQTIEYQIALENGEFHPGEGDGKEIRYLIAVCSNRQEPLAAVDSLMIDLSEVAFRGVPGRERWHDSALYFDSGNGYQGNDVVYEKVEYKPEFRVHFSLNPATDCRGLRWDPLERRLCSLRLGRVQWRDGEDHCRQFDVSEASSNGQRSDEGVFRFETVDPMIFLPITGSVSSVTIEGECVVENEQVSLQGMETLLANRNGELHWMRHLFQDRDRRLLECEEQLRQREEQLRQREQQLQQREQQLRHCEQQMRELSDKAIAKRLRSALSSIRTRLGVNRDAH